MLFVIDVGNSHTVTGLYDGDKLIGKWRLQSDRKATDDELAIRYNSLFAMENIDTSKVRGVILASVVPVLEAAWASCCRKYLFRHLEDPVCIVSSTNVSDLISIKLSNPSEIGADRLVNSIAAYHQYKCNLVVVDFGTAITFDCVSANCEYLGGAILPGIAISLDALSTRTAKLPQINVTDPPERVIGTSTVEAMKSGILYGYGAMLDGMLNNIQKELTTTDNPDMTVVATGGMAGIVKPFSERLDHVAPLLTLEGLKIIHEKKGSL